MASEGDDNSEPDVGPKIISHLVGGIVLREPWPSENDFFRDRPEVAGMAADDGCVVLNPYSTLSESEEQAVLLNESARIFMRLNGIAPTFVLTADQEAAFSTYGPLDSIKATVAARILSNDPSALQPTDEQLLFVQTLKAKMGLSST